MTDKQTVSDDQFMQVSEGQLAFNVIINVNILINLPLNIN